MSIHVNRPRRHGAVLMLVALGLVAFLAMLGLVVDGGNLYLVRQKAQTAADASALAAAACIPTTDAAHWPSDATLREWMEESAGNIAVLNASLGSGVITTVVYPYQNDHERVEIINTTYFQPLFLPIVGQKTIMITNRAVAKHTRGDSLITMPFGTTAGLYAKRITLGKIGVPSTAARMVIDSYDSTKGLYNAPLPGGGVNRTDTASVIAKEQFIGVAALNGLTVGGNITAGRYTQATALAGSTINGNVVVTEPSVLVSPLGGTPLIPGLPGTFNILGIPLTPAVTPKITGTLRYKSPALTATVGGDVTGGKFSNQPVTMPAITLNDIDFSVPAVSNNNAGIASPAYLSNSNPPDLNMTAPGSVLNLEAGTYYFRNVNLTGAGSQINILSGPVFMYVQNRMQVDGGSSINNNSKDPNRLQVYIGVNSNLLTDLLNTWDFAGSFHGGIYAPRSSMTLLGGGEFFGNVIVGENLTVALSGKFHIDQGLYATQHGATQQPVFKLME